MRAPMAPGNGARSNPSFFSPHLAHVIVGIWPLSVSFITINYRLSTSNLSRHRTRRGRPRRVSPGVIGRIPVRHGAIGPEPRAQHLAARWRGQRHRGATGPDVHREPEVFGRAVLILHAHLRWKDHSRLARHLQVDHAR